MEDCPNLQSSRTFQPSGLIFVDTKSRTSQARRTSRYWNILEGCAVDLPRLFSPQDVLVILMCFRTLERLTFLTFRSGGFNRPGRDTGSKRCASSLTLRSSLRKPCRGIGRPQKAEKILECSGRINLRARQPGLGYSLPSRMEDRSHKWYQIPEIWLRSMSSPLLTAVVLLFPRFINPFMIFWGS